ncbi:hypothetical protein BJY00DRAFT_318937 [Aspergillus carlsbadensis]|nr:hypothetical protein BJY00DRAFT_318937 [Aspergillus carlsbadensis]
MNKQLPLAPRGTPIQPRFLARKKKSSQACDSCRIQRRRCGGARPCTGCRILGEQCTYSGADGRKRECWKAQIAALELRNSYLEQIIQQAPLPPVTQSDLTQSSTSLGPLGGSNVSGGRLDASNSVCRVFPTFPCTKDVEHLFCVATSTNLNLPSLDTKDMYGRSDYMSSLPPERFTRLAVDAFFRHASTLFYVSTAENSTRLLEKVYHTDNATLQDVYELCALAAIGSQYNTAEIPDRVRAAYFYIASMWLKAAIVPVSIQGLRIYIWLCMTLIMEKSLSARHLIVSAMNFARERMLPDLYKGQLTWGQDDEYRRTLQTLIFLEGWLSYSLGYQSCRNQAEISLILNTSAFPHHDTEDTSALRARLIQYHMMELILLAWDLQQEINYSRPADLLFARLDTWHMSLPSDLNLTALLTATHTRSAEPVIEPQRHALYLMHLLYMDVRLQLYRRLLKASYNYTPSAGPRNKACENSYCSDMFKQLPSHVVETTVGFAVQVARIAALMYTDSGIFARCWLVIRSVFDAGVVLLITACQRCNHSSPVDINDMHMDELFRHVEACLAVLAFCSRRDIAADRLRSMLEPALCQPQNSPKYHLPNKTAGKADRPQRSTDDSHSLAPITNDESSGASNSLLGQEKRQSQILKMLSKASLLHFLSLFLPFFASSTLAQPTQVLDLNFPDPAVISTEQGYYAFGTQGNGLRVPVARSDDFDS